MRLLAFIMLAFASASSAILPALADHPIPADSKQPWDFRGKPSGFTDPDYEKLFKCQTYEELRDLLPEVVRSIEENADCAAAIYVASGCQLALIRTHYLLGEVEQADKLLARYGAALQPEKLLAVKVKEAEQRRESRDSAARLKKAQELDAGKDRKCLELYAELLHASEFAIRWQSLDRLRQLTGQEFEYYASGVPEERAGPAERWQQWIETQGSEAKIDWSRP